MANFAKLNKKFFVEETINIPDEALLDENGVYNELLGINYCKKLYNNTGVFVEFKKDGSIRGGRPGKGWKYNSNLNKFIIPTPPDDPHADQPPAWEDD